MISFPLKSSNNTTVRPCKGGANQSKEKRVRKMIIIFT
jgi:hypothetical protein